MYFALHTSGTHATGRYVGMSFDGDVITGHSSLARSADQAEQILANLSPLRGRHMSEPEIVDVTITGPDPDWLAEHTRSLVEQRLAACGNIIPTIRSIYRWQDQIEDEPEAYVILHTQAEHVAEIIRLTNEAHPYDTVHILATQIVDADPRYKAWVRD